MIHNSSSRSRSAFVSLNELMYSLRGVKLGVVCSGTCIRRADKDIRPARGSSVHSLALSVKKDYAEGAQITSFAFENCAHELECV